MICAEDWLAFRVDKSQRREVSFDTKLGLEALRRLPVEAFQELLDIMKTASMPPGIAIDI